jgi:hypothetical protein
MNAKRASSREQQVEREPLKIQTGVIAYGQLPNILDRQRTTKPLVLKRKQ